MIKVHTEPYCEGCIEFEVQQEKNILMCSETNSVAACYIHITCANKDKCNRIHKFLKDQFTNAEE